MAGQPLDIAVTLKEGTSGASGAAFGANAVTYDFATQRLDEMPLPMKDDKVTFRVLVDRPMFEVVGGDGACYKTSGRADMGKPLGTIWLSTQAGRSPSSRCRPTKWAPRGNTNKDRRS